VCWRRTGRDGSERRETGMTSLAVKEHARATREKGKDRPLALKGSFFLLLEFLPHLRFISYEPSPRLPSKGKRRPNANPLRETRLPSPPRRRIWLATATSLSIRSLFHLWSTQGPRYPHWPPSKHPLTMQRAAPAATRRSRAYRT
jgi:hypothetical protein